MRIGLDLGGTKIECAFLGNDGQELVRRRVPTPRDDYDGTLEAIRSLLAGCAQEVAARALSRENRSPLASIPVDAGIPGAFSALASIPVGVGIPGSLSPATGLVKNANSTWLIGHPLQEDLARVLRRPVRLANDANCFALSEATDGAGAGHSVVFGVIIGTGTGGGIAVDGRILTGPNAVSGEWGHNPLPWPRPDELPGPECYCGRRGCIETFLSGPAFVRDYLDERRRGALDDSSPLLSPPAWDAPSVVRRAEQGDLMARAALDRYVERMGRALASVINLLDPDAIVLGGGMSNLEVLYSEVPRFWKDRVFSDRVDTPLLRARHGDSSGVRGAAWLWPDTPLFT